MTETPQIGEFKRQYEEVHSMWKDFYRYRNLWDKLIDRRLPTELDPTLKRYSQGIDIESPFLAKDRGVNIMTLTLDKPKFDAIPLRDIEKAKEAVEKNRIWHAASFMKQNPGNKIMKGISQGVVQYGLAWVRKDWDMPKEPGEDYYSGKGLDIDDEMEEEPRKQRMSDRDKARSEYYEDKDHCFSMQVISPLEMCCSDLEDPDIIFQRSTIPYSVARNKVRSLDGKKLRLDQLGKLFLLGPSEADSEDATYTTQSEQKKISLIIRDMRDPEKGKWTTTELVCIDGEDISEGQILNEYENPLGRSRYFLIPSGDEVPLQSDPHLRFLPMLYSELVLVADKNYYSNLLAGLSRMQITDGFFYVDGSTLTAESASALEHIGFSLEGAGATKAWRMPRPQPGSEELAILPGNVQAWPFPDLEHLKFLIEQNERELAFERPSRWGNRYGQAQEPSAPTATQELAHMQADAMPYSSYLGPMTQFCEDQAVAEAHAILEWEHDVPDDMPHKPYSVVTTGDEPLLKEPVDAAKEVTVSAETFKHKYHVVVDISNETMAEHQQKELAADDRYMKGKTDEEQWLKESGFQDAQKQIKILRKDKARKETEAEFAPVRMQMRKSYFSNITGINLMAPMEPMRQEMQQQSGGGKPQGNLVEAKPQMTAAPIERPNATSGVGGMV